jgi:hypothetical protein
LIPGEVHFLIAENRADKSTLVNILSGAYRGCPEFVEVEERSSTPPCHLVGRGRLSKMMNRPTATPPRPRVVTESEVEDLEVPERVTIALSDLAVVAKQGLLALAVSVGLAMVEEIFEEEVPRLVGACGQHVGGRFAYRH